MIIYIEDTILSNFLICYLIIVLSSKLVMINVRPSLCVLASLFASITSLFTPLIINNYLIIIILKLIISLIICFFCILKINKKIIILNLSFLFVTALFGGVITGLNNIIKLENNVFIIFLIILFTFYLFYKLIKIIYTKKTIKNYSFETEIIHNKIHVKSIGYLDTGNTLKDNLKGKPVVIIDTNLLQKILPNENVLSVILNGKLKTTMSRQLKVSSVNSVSKIIIFEIDTLKIFINGVWENYTDVCLGLSYSDYKETLGCEMILNPILLQGV